MVDTHCHLADEAFAGDLPDVVARALDAGVHSGLCIISSDDPAEIGRAQGLETAWPGLRVATGVHPHRVARFGADVSETRRLTRETVAVLGAVAVGEIGLDYHYDFAPRDVQREHFAAQVALAVELGLPVVLHTRDAAADTMAILRQAGGDLRGIVHCFTGTIDEAREALDLGLFVSLAGMLTFPKAASLREVAAFVPGDRLLLETDAPYLAPVPHRGRRNEPAWVIETLRVAATTRGVAAGDLGELVVRNFDALTGGGVAKAAVHRVDTPPKPMV